MIPKNIIYPLRFFPRLFNSNAATLERSFRDGFSGLLELPHPCLPIGRARTGIYLLVKEFITSKRTKVILSPYTIPDLVNMVIFAGGTPVFFDHEPGSTHADPGLLEDLIDDDVACVLLTHYHVNQQHFNEIRSICERNDVALLEDCAISLGGTIDGRSVGIGSTAGVFSLSGYKLLNYYWGGAVVSQDGGLLDKLNTETSEWKRLRNLDYGDQWLRVFKYAVATRPVVFGAVTAPVLRRKQRTCDIASLRQPRIESDTFDDSLRSRPSAAAFAEWIRKLGTVRTHLAHQRRIAAVYDQILGDIMVGRNTSEAIQAGSCFVNYPVWIEGKRRNDVYKEMILGRFDVGLNMYPNSHEHPKFRNVEGSSKEISLLCASMITLPTHPRVSPNYAEALATRLKSIL